jgi:hypothetical protein
MGPSVTAPDPLTPLLSLENTPLRCFLEVAFFWETNLSQGRGVPHHYFSLREGTEMRNGTRRYRNHPHAEEDSVTPLAVKIIRHISVSWTSVSPHEKGVCSVGLWGMK